MQRSSSAARKSDANGKAKRPSSGVQAGAEKAPAARRRTKAAADAQGGSVAAHAVPERHALVREAAYFLAEKRGFAPGREIDDWVRAEAEIERVLASPR